MGESNQEDKLYVNTNKQIQIENPSLHQYEIHLHAFERRAWGKHPKKKLPMPQKELYSSLTSDKEARSVHTAIRYWASLASIELQNGCLAIPTQINPNHKGVVMVCTRLVKWLVADIRFSN